MAMPTGRQGMVAIGNVLAAHASLMNYSEAADRSEMWNLTWAQAQARLAAGEPLTADCSGCAEAVAKWSGAPIGPLGYTSTELQVMPHITVAEALPGDFIVFGAAPGLHVVWVTEAHPTNPKIDSHGRPGFDQGTLQQMWQGGFPGQPITVLSLAPFLPKPPAPKPSMHYDRYDAIKVRLPANLAQTAFVQESEEQIVRNYDQSRQHPKANAKTLEIQELKLAQLVTNLENVMAAHDPKGLKFDRAWRLPRLVARANGQIVKPD